jgi:catalase
LAESLERTTLFVSELPTETRGVAMRAYHRSVLGLALAALVAAAPAARADDPALPFKIVDQFNANFGVHPGFRANHAKGAVFEGTFTPAPSAKDFSKAAHLQDAPVPITVRFSNAGGLPDAPDTHPSMRTRGMAIKFHLPGGGITDIVSISSNGFPVSNGEDFLALIEAVGTTKPDSPHPTPLETFLSAHPVAAKALSSPQPIPVSYATLPFFGVNAFKFTNAAGVSHFGRYRIVPEAGEHYLSDADAAKLDPNFLADDVRTRLKTGPVKFKLLVQVAAPDDKTDDATVVWPDSRPLVELGEISIATADPDSLQAEKKLLFVPTNVTAGIDLSADPLLPLRAAAYGVSFGRRSK